MDWGDAWKIAFGALSALLAVFVKAWIDGRQQRWQTVHKMQFETEFEAYRGMWERVIKVREAAMLLVPTVEILPANETPAQMRERKIMPFVDSYNDFGSFYIQRQPFIATNVFMAAEKFRLALDKEFKAYSGHPPFNVPKERSDWDRYMSQTDLDGLITLADNLCNAIRKRIWSDDHTMPTTKMQPLEPKARP